MSDDDSTFFPQRNRYSFKWFNRLQQEEHIKCKQLGHQIMNIAFPCIACEIDSIILKGVKVWVERWLILAINKQQTGNGGMNSETFFWRLNSPLVAEGLPSYYNTVSERITLPWTLISFVHSKILLALYSVFTSKQQTLKKNAIN